MPTRPTAHRRVSGCAVLVTFAAMLALSSCSSPGSDDPLAAPAPGAASATPRPTTTPPKPTDDGPDRPTVLAISIDGLNPEALTTLGPTGAPALWRLIDEGASTLNARTSLEITTTLPNHSGMLTGRPVGGRDGTSVTFNSDNGETLREVHGSYVPGMFDVAHDRGVTTALFAEKDKFRFLVRSWDGEHGAKDVTGTDDGTDKLTDAEIGGADVLVGDVTDTLVDGTARLVFWHIAAPDVAGHTYGWLTPEYLDAVRDADEQVGQVLDVIDDRSRSGAKTDIVLTADHGGPRDARRHDMPEELANYRIPFIVWASGARERWDLYALNPARRDPGTSRSDYSGAQPVRNFDLANTSLALLGLPPVPGTPNAPLTVR